MSDDKLDRIVKLLKLMSDDEPDNISMVGESVLQETVALRLLYWDRQMRTHAV